MAIDTAEKRRSVAGIAFHPLGPAVTPNILKDVEWRQQAGWGYSGIFPATGVVPAQRIVYLIGSYVATQDLDGSVLAPVIAGSYVATQTLEGSVSL